MGENLARKILADHLVHGELKPGEEIAIRVDQTLTQDATGTMAYLQFEAIGLPRVQTSLSVSYVDHNTLQTGFENADDHRFLQSFAAKYGLYFSRPGNGICHQVQLERFSVPGAVLLGSDSHTPTSGGVGALAIGVGGLDVAVAMAGSPFYLAMPRVMLVRLTGSLRPWVTGKDVILELLRRLTVKSGVGYVIEYGGPGVAALTVPERATITNMGAELGATTSVFPSDEATRAYFRAQKRENMWRPLAADLDATYDAEIELDLSTLEPLIAQPHSPDNVTTVSAVEGTRLDQVAIGSCTNSSFRDLSRVAAILRGKTVHPSVSLVISPGSRRVYEMIARSGALADLISAGARLLETACGPCIGMGQAPPSGGVSLRTFNRNFEGRCGTPDGLVYLASPEVAAASALTGHITDPRHLEIPIALEVPEESIVDDRFILPPADDPSSVEIVRGPNIKPLPTSRPLAETIEGPVLLKVGDNITTDHIMPAGAKLLPLRSNVPALAEYVFAPVDLSFARRAKETGGGVVVGGANYGQGSSREHAALCPMYLGLRAVLTKSFARIHRANLVNFGILPLTFAQESDYNRIAQGDQLVLPEIRERLQSGQPILVQNVTRGYSFEVCHTLTPREIQIILAGGLLPYVRDPDRSSVNGLGVASR
ncbi:MAG: aconitate hydratase [Chloroflexota bacterium]|nr:MAG: aconitate hydratase [Chloroflexota bacterium]